MATRKKGGQRLIEMARKRRKSSSKPKANNRLKEQLEEYKARRPKPKRQKGGQKLLTPRKRQTRVTKEDRTGGRYSVTPLPKPKPKAKVRKYTTKEKAQYREQYERTARAKPPQKSKPTKKTVVTPPKGTERPGAGLTKRLTTIRKKAASSKAARSRTARQTPKGAGRSLRADLTKQQKALVAEGKKIAKKFGLKIPAPSVKTAEKIGLPIELAGWVALAIATRGKTKGKVASTWSKLKNVFKPKGTPVGGGRNLETVTKAHTALARGGRSAKEIADAKKAAQKVERLRKKLLADQKLKKELATLDAAARKRAGIGSAASRGAK